MEQILINKLQNIMKDHRASVNHSLSEVLLRNLNHIKTKTINEIAMEANCSKSSVVKFAKYLGLDGYKELIQRLNIEANILVPQLTLINPFAPTPNQAEIELLSNYYELVSSNLQYIQNNFLQEIIKASTLIKQSKKIFLFGKGSNLNGMQILANYLMKLNY
jgi:DNA-binding MurR/RpiR family transcriptional regulator